MCYRHPSNLKRTNLDSLAGVHGHKRCADTRLSKLTRDHVASERCCVDWTAKLLPEMGQRANMIFMRMRGNNASKGFMPISNKKRVRHFDPIARSACYRVFEGDATVDH